jgi:putative intracellular protease/amidase
MTDARPAGSPMQIAIGLYEGFTALDAIGPYQVFSNVPGVEVVICAERAGALWDDNHLLHFEIDHTFTDVARPDVLLVPGGVITRKLARDRAPIVDWIAQAHPHTTWTTSVCTGALLLGAAGLLDGLPATTHWVAYDELAGYGARPTEQRVVQTGKIITGAGVSAGIDLALLVAGLIWGDDMAKILQLAIEYDPQPPYDAGSPTKAGPDLMALVSGAVAEQEAAL